MKSYVILALLILGHLCQIQAATLSKPAMSTDDAKKLLIEKLSHSNMEHREELIQPFETATATPASTAPDTTPPAMAVIKGTSRAAGICSSVMSPVLLIP
uniref:Putative conserved secreted protein n=1 Tax=Rhipicephalus microplus TaxID=6941 RepID=A0A6M2CGU7_RHIMP